MTSWNLHLRNQGPQQLEEHELHQRSMQYMYWHPLRRIGARGQWTLHAAAMQQMRQATSHLTPRIG